MSSASLMIRAGTAALVAIVHGGTVSAEPLASGPYAFSDELGGLHLKSVTGSGSADDPIILVEEFFNTGPAVLTIRRLDAEPTSPGGLPAPPAPILYIQKRVINQSRRAWLGFELELQETRGETSTYSDGLSFDQIGKRQDRVHADLFRHGERTFEPADRLLFHGGAVDHGQTLNLSLVVTDTSPANLFFLVQSPQLATASLPGPLYASIVTEDRPYLRAERSDSPSIK
ncbi:MAG: hypothetical protein ACTSYE_06000 [Alphaproteobacteria bacterium]